MDQRANHNPDESNLFFMEIEAQKLAKAYFENKGRIQFVVSNWEARRLKNVVNLWIKVNEARGHKAPYSYVGFIVYGSAFFVLSMYIALFHSRARDAHSFYMSNQSRIEGLEDRPYSVNKDCTVVNIYRKAI